MRVGKNVIVGTTKENEASIFYIEKQACPREFNITYYGEEFSQMSKSKSSQHLTQNCKSSQHLTTLSKMMGGRDEGPLQIGGNKRAANFTLRHPGRRKEDLGIEFWETDACFIKLAPRPMQKKSYIAFDMHQNKTKVISCRGEGGVDCCMRFCLNRVKIGSCPSKCRIFADFDEPPEPNEQEAPSTEEGIVFPVTTRRQSEPEPEGTATSDATCVAAQRVACDGEEEVTEGSGEDDDSDFDFEFEFEPASDSD